jgi:hypothetical protein
MPTQIDPFNFPGLSANSPIADKNGKPTFTFIGWFNSLLNTLKTALNQITANVLELEALSAKVDQQGQNYNNLAKIATTGSASDLVKGTVPDARLANVNPNVGTFGDATHVAQVTLDAKGRVTAAANIAISGAGSGITALTGDVVATGPGSVPATIQNGAVTYAKMQASSQAEILVGRGEGAGAGTLQEITLAGALSMSGTVLKGQAYQPMTTGSEPMVFLSDGLGNPVMVAFDP